MSNPNWKNQLYGDLIRPASPAQGTPEPPIHEIAKGIVSRLTEHAIRIEWTRADLTSESENTEDECVEDAIAVALGEDTGCLDPDDLNATNCELLFVEAELKKLAALAGPQNGQGWVRVEDGLPEIDRLVLIATNEGGVWTGKYREYIPDGTKASQKRFWMPTGNGTYAANWKVTHWQPLPAPPTGDAPTEKKL
jgi:hypothetical protein